MKNGGVWLNEEGRGHADDGLIKYDTGTSIVAPLECGPIII